MGGYGESGEVSKQLVAVGKVIRWKYDGIPRHIVAITFGKKGERVAVLAQWEGTMWIYDAEEVTKIEDNASSGRLKVGAR